MGSLSFLCPLLRMLFGSQERLSPAACLVLGANSPSVGHQANKVTKQRGLPHETHLRCMKRPLADMKRSFAAYNAPHEEQK